MGVLLVPSRYTFGRQSYNSVLQPRLSGYIRSRLNSLCSLFPSHFCCRCRSCSSSSPCSCKRGAAPRDDNDCKDDAGRLKMDDLFWNHGDLCQAALALDPYVCDNDYVAEACPATCRACTCQGGSAPPSDRPSTTRRDTTTRETIKGASNFLTVSIVGVLGVLLINYYAL